MVFYGRKETRDNMGFTDKLKDIANTANKIANSLKNAKTESKEFSEEVFYVVGTAYYKDNIKKIMKPNKEYKSQTKTIIKNGHVGQKIFQYLYLDTPAELIPEPQNEHDKNAVKVCIDGKLVGYIKREETLKIKKLLKTAEIKYINALVTGGKYKIIFLNDDVFKDENNFIIRLKIGYYK